MGRIVISENVSLDGVIQDPTGEDGFGRGGWFTRIGDKDREEWAKVELEEARGAEALFGETSSVKPLRLVDIRAVGDCLALLTYRPVRDG